MRWRPYRDLAGMATEMNRLLGAHEGDRQDECLMGSWAPAVDIFEDDDKVEMTFEVPGIDRKDLDVEVHEGTLSIRGARNLERDEQRDSYRRIERSYGSFCRTFSLPENILVDGITAVFKDGLLVLVLPKAEKARPKKVAVDVE